MHKLFEETVEALEALAEVVVQAAPDEVSLKEKFGYPAPIVDGHDLAKMAQDLADSIKRADPEDVDEYTESLLGLIPGRLLSLHGDTVPYMFNPSYYAQAIHGYIGSILWIRYELERYLYWVPSSDPKNLPVSIARRIRGVKASVEEIEGQSQDLGTKIALINGAYEAAQSLPADMDSLRSYRREMENISSKSATEFGKIEEITRSSSEVMASLRLKEQEAGKIVKQSEEAYRGATSVGLAASFDERARSLSSTLWVWVAGLLTALAIGSFLAYNRIDEISRSLSIGNINWGVVVAHVGLSVFSIGAPFWFAWLATKQIGHRFKLAEDYAFKASVAKAYEGYRREAAKIDVDLESRLFSSALTRLEEAPLRLVEDQNHGSPWHELLSSDGFKIALSKVPELKSDFAEISRKMLGSTSKESAPGPDVSLDDAVPGPRDT